MAEPIPAAILPDAIVTVAQMRAAEQAAGVPLSQLMAQAGAAVAAMARRLAAGRPIHFLCGPGNNGGDAYVAAQILAEMGENVRLSASAPPASSLARDAALRWTGAVEPLDAPPVNGVLLVDGLFGVGLNRPLDGALAAALGRHADAAWRTLAVDLPSGLGSDGGDLLGCPYVADVTLALGAYKGAHLLFPAAGHIGTLRLADLGMKPDAPTRIAALPPLTPPDAASHKYNRGMVAVVAGSMGGAAELAARAAQQAGAGYIILTGSNRPPTPPHAIIRAPWRDGEMLEDPRINAVVIGCGLGRGAGAEARFSAALARGIAMVVDGDAIVMTSPGTLPANSILTPHAGEFARIWPGAGDKIGRTRAAAAHFGAVIIHKGADSVIAAPDGRVAVHSPGNPWLASAGTGDVLAGICGAMLARGELDAFDAAQAAVLLHQRAAARAGPGLNADNLVAAPIWP